MKKIYLVRHGQSITNAGGALQPNPQIQITELGKRQAEEVADWIIQTLGSNVDSINISKFIRTKQTAQPLIDKTGVQPNVIDGLEEFDYLSFAALDGVAFAKRLEEADAFWAHKAPDDLHGADAESYQSFYNRVATVLAHFKSLPAGNHVVYTHGLWISMLVWQILGQPHESNLDMRKFRQFELSIRAKNCEVFCLTLAGNDLLECLPPAITKVRTCDGDNSDLSAKL